MYFFILIFLIFVLIPSSLENKNHLIIYLKIFISSAIYFYLINRLSDSILIFLLTLITYSIIFILIYRLLEDKSKPNFDNNLFNLAHEVKNPISVCKGYLDMLDINDKEKLNKYLPIIKSEIKRTLSIMDEFLSIKRINLNKDLMDFSLLIEDIEETTRWVLKDNNISLKTFKTDKEIIIDADYDKLKQVLINLIKNSYEADAKNIKINFKVIGNNLLIKIIDDGKGISKNDLEKIGDMFYTTKITGTGVGISMSNEIIKLHDGRLSYKSKINKGTTATIMLPIKYIF